MSILAGYRKLVAGVVGMAAIVLYHYTGVELAGVEPVLVDTIIAAFTAWGIWGLKNEPAPAT
jgi:hypothetical protein